jgi:hypothetical protein
MGGKLIKTNETKVPYVLAGISFIPLIGVLFGIIAIIWGIIIKKKGPILLGTGGILLSVVLYGSLFYFGVKANYGPYHELKKQLTKQLLTQTRGQVLIYKEKNKALPDKLSDLGSPSQDNFFPISDPWLNEFEYKVNADGSFELRSYGPDAVPYNGDDIVSSE